MLDRSVLLTRQVGLKWKKFKAAPSVRAGADQAGPKVKAEQELPDIDSKGEEAGRAAEAEDVGGREAGPGRIVQQLRGQVMP